MIDNVFDRRIRIIEYIKYYSATTRQMLANHFRVSLSTIDRDLIIINNYVPIYTNRGNQGGVYILQDKKEARIYLTREEENVLRLVIKKSKCLRKQNS